MLTWRGEDNTMPTKRRISLLFMKPSVPAGHAVDVEPFALFVDDGVASACFPARQTIIKPERWLITTPQWWLESFKVAGEEQLLGEGGLPISVMEGHPPIAFPTATVGQPIIARLRNQTELDQNLLLAMSAFTME